jgi:hypothetical protein
LEPIDAHAGQGGGENLKEVIHRELRHRLPIIIHSMSNSFHRSMPKPPNCRPSSGPRSGLRQPRSQHRCSLWRLRA